MITIVVAKLRLFCWIIFSDLEKKLWTEVFQISSYLIFQFEGTTGEKLIQVSAEFTKNQKFSIEELKERRKRDHKLDLFLNEQRLRPECRRLGLEALLPVEHQRLVKYPLLLDQLAKQCDKESEEFAKVRRCVDRSREILDSIDKQVAEAQNIQRLAEIQRNLDASGLEKMPESPITNEYRVSIQYYLISVQRIEYALQIIRCTYTFIRNC